MAIGGDAWLGFMGNEFGHPEWIDFPRRVYIGLHLNVYHIVPGLLGRQLAVGTPARRRRLDHMSPTGSEQLGVQTMLFLEKCGQLHSTLRLCHMQTCRQGNDWRKRAPHGSSGMEWTDLNVLPGSLSIQTFA